MKKILTITDSYNWATYFRAINLQKNLTQYNFDIVAFADINKFNFDKYDVVYITNWPIYGYVKHKISKNRKYKLVTGVSSHIGRDNANKMIPFFKIFDVIGTSNNFLFNEFASAKLSSIYTPFGADSNIFKKDTNLNKLNTIFGWVGNKNRSVKRFEQISKVLEEFGKACTFKYISQESNMSHKQMNEFYNSIGTLICFSESEGTPNPVIEAAMCGRWIISTNVGNIPELTKNIKEFTPVFDKKDLKKQIENIIQNNNLENNGNLFLKEAKINRTWENRSKNFIPLFE